MHITIWKTNALYNLGELAYFYAKKVCPPYMVGQDFYANGKKYVIKQIAHGLIQDSDGRVLDTKLEIFVSEVE